MSPAVEMVLSGPCCAGWDMCTDALGEFPRDASGQRIPERDGNLPLLGCLVTSVTGLCFSSAFQWVRSAALPIFQLSVVSPGNHDEEISHRGGARRCSGQQTSWLGQSRCSDASHSTRVKGLHAQGSPDAREVWEHLHLPSIQLPLSPTPSQIKIGKPETD